LIAAGVAVADPSQLVIGLEESSCQDIRLAGGKAALLARAIADGMPVLSGFVVPAPVSRPHLDLGREQLRRHGSGRARLSVSMTPLDEPLRQALIRRGTDLGATLVARSSAVVETGGVWSGAFTSYLEVSPIELPRAVTGCWASSFTVAALDRHEAAGIGPGTIDMAILVQPALIPDFAGSAHISDGVTVVTAIAGSPVALVQGWEPGLHARIGPGTAPAGTAVDVVGRRPLARIDALLRRAAASLGATGCEWAMVGEELVLLQLVISTETRHGAQPVFPRGLDTEAAQRVARLTRRFPGELGSELVLPWALGSKILPGEEAPAKIAAEQAFQAAKELAADLTAEVWGLPARNAAAEARQLLRGLRGSDPAAALSRLISLSPPDNQGAARVLSLLTRVRQSLYEIGVVSSPELAWHVATGDVSRWLAGGAPTEVIRVGVDRWDPFNIATIQAADEPAQGVAAAPGIGFGRLRWIANPEQMGSFRQREIVVTRHPVPNLAPLLWDAAGLVSISGNPGAHLFESARALGIPAVCGVDLESVLGIDFDSATGFALCVDGDNGTVHVSPW
jgi:hypothetical protein